MSILQKLLFVMFSATLALLTGCSDSTTGYISSASNSITSATPSVNSLSLTEGQSKTFSVNLSTPTSSAMTVSWAIQNKNAQAQSLWQKVISFSLTNSDFSNSSGSITIPAGGTQATITIDSLADSKFEDTENYDVVITGTAFTGRLVIPLSVTDSDAAPVVSMLNSYVNEGETAILLFKLDKRSELDTKVQISIQDDSAVSNTDFTPPSDTTVTIPPNTLIYGIEIPTTNNNVFTGDKQFKVNLTGATGATVGTAQKNVFILDDENGPKISVADVSVNEDAGFADVTVTLSQASSASVLFDWATEDRTAYKDEDYSEVSATDAVILAGQTSTVIRVPLIDDTSDELDETFKILLSNARNASLSDYEAIITITDNDNPPTIQWNVLAQSVNEGVGTVTVRAELSAISGKTVSASIAKSGTVNTNDHNFTATSISILPGLAYKDIEFQVTNDNLTASNKTLILTLSSPLNSNLGANTVHTVNIIDDDGAPVIFVGNATISEGAGTATIPVSLGSGLESGESVTFDWTVSPGTATTPADFTATPGTVTINGPASVANITITINDDNVFEGPENFSVTVSNASGSATIQAGAGTGYITINDNEAQPQINFQLANQTVTEAVGSATAVIQLDRAAGQDVIIPYTVTGTATYTEDHNLDGGSITIPAGATSANIIIPITDDLADEPAETVVITLQNPTGADLGSQNIHSLTLNDNDAAPTISIGNAAATEGANVNLNVTLSQVSGQNVTVDYTLAAGTAANPADFNPSSLTGTVTFYPGETSKQISVQTVDDTLAEAAETFSVTLANPTGATISSGTATGTINDNEGPLTISIDDSGANEGQNVTLTVTLSSAAGSNISVDYATADGDNGTASLNATLANSDYTAKSGTLTIPAGQTTGTIVVSTTTDSAYESNEKFRVVLSNPSSGTISDNTGYGTIINDDTAPVIQFAQTTSSVAESAGTHTVTVSLGQVQAAPVTIDFALTGTATGSGTDYSTSTTSPITFAAGETSKTISFTIVDDSSVESTETVIITLSNPTGAGSILGANTVHTVSITDNDTPPTVSSFNPASGNVASMPTSVQVTFSRTMDATSTQTTGNWSLSCASGTASITGVVLAGAVATVSINTTVQPTAGDACTLTAGTNIKDSSNNNLTGSVGSRQAVYTKVNPASVTSVNSSTSNGCYGIGSSINIQVVFSEAVNVTGGTPTITLDTGATVNLTSGSGTTTLSGTYTVASSQNSSDLNYSSTSALANGGATITSVASSTTATLTLPGLAAAGSLATNKAIQVDTTAPSAPSSLSDGTWLNSTTTSPTITFNNGSDGGGCGINRHEARVIRNSDSAEMKAYASFSTGGTIGSMTLADTIQYKVQIKAIDNAGNESTVATSDGWTVDTTNPNAPTGVTLGSVPASSTDSPTITYTAGTDATSGISAHQVQIIKTSDSSVIRAWAAHTSGTAVTGMSLTDATQYSVLVRALDNAGNYSSQTAAVNWTSNTDACTGTPSIGTVCGGGSVYAGVFSNIRYMTTPGNCNNSATPTCPGTTDSLQLAWAATSPGPSAIAVTGATSTTDGPGNTTLLATNYGDTLLAKFCDNMTFGGYSDWFLPALDELNFIYTNRIAIGGFETTGNSYATSTEHNLTDYKRIRFNDGNQAYQGKNFADRVRCVRRDRLPPTNLSLGATPSDDTETRTLTFTAPPANGSVTVASYEAQVWNLSGPTLAQDWTAITNGGKITGLSLTHGATYYMKIRAVGSDGSKWSSAQSSTWTSGNDPCFASPTPGTVCSGGSIFLGTLSPGATSGSGTDRYMTTPGGCSNIPAGSISGGSGATSYALADFTPTTCTGTDATTKTWNDGTSNWYSIPGVTHVTTAGNGQAFAGLNTDGNYGSTNTTNIAAVTAAGQGGYHAAARYCEKLSYGGYTDWYLPNRYELNLMYTNRASVPGLNVSGAYYTSSTGYSADYAWVESMNDGYERNLPKNSDYLVRCVRRF